MAEATYPCANAKGGYIKCSVDEWLTQQILEGSKKK